MADQIDFNEDVTRQLEAVYATRDVRRRRALVHDALAASPGERVLDVGCGPGFYVAEVLDRVGPEGAVAGLDASAAMLQVAGQRSSGKADLRQGDATDLPFDDASFDAALSVQVLEYVADVDRALAELHRVVRPGGRVVLWDVDWSTLSMRTDDAERMAWALAMWDRHLADPVLPRTLATRMGAAGFADVRAEGHVFLTTELNPEAYGGFLVPFLEGYLAGLDDVDASRADAWGDEQRALDADGAFYFCVVQCCFAATRP